MTLLRGGRKEGLCPSAFGLTPGYLPQEETGGAVRRGPHARDTKRDAAALRGELR